MHFQWYGELIDKVFGKVGPTEPSITSLIVKEPIGVIAGIHGILKPATAVKITPNTSAIITRFDVTNGTALAATNGGADVYIGLGPFDISIAAQ